MAREKAGYRDALEFITQMFPDRVALKPSEVAEYLGVNIKTVTAAIQRKRDPLPAKDVGGGKKNHSYIIPITELARWSSF